MSLQLCICFCKLHLNPVTKLNGKMSMAEKSEESIEDVVIPDRPMECSECKKPIAVHYTEITNDNVVQTAMCADCPCLQQHLRGASAEGLYGTSSGVTGLCCGNCGTTLEGVRMGTPLGCSACYDVFGDILLPELQAANKISPRIAIAKKSLPIHIGRAPGEANEISPSLRLLALNEALNETLKREDYEQAAWLRDQIKDLTEKPSDSNEGPKIPPLEEDIKPKESSSEGKD